ncbi:MAG: hypothetical protein Kow0042_10790 [Calditrichia bacterium]
MNGSNKFAGFVKTVLFTLLFSAFPAFAQVTLNMPLQIMDGINSGDIQYTVEPEFTTNSIENVFDLNRYTYAGVQGSNILKITLAFADTVEISESKVSFQTMGNWSLEIADNEYDLNQATGSYKLLVNQRPHQFFSWDSVSFPTESARYIRLTEETTFNNILIGEWVLEEALMLTSLFIKPNSPKIIPGTNLQLKVEAVDEHNKLHPYTLSEPIIWSTANPAIATIGEFGLLHGVAVGNTQVMARTLSGSLTDTTDVEVLADFQSTNAPTLNMKVALVIQDPIIDPVNNRRIHELWGWTDPYELVNQIKSDFTQASDGVVNFQIVETHDDTMNFTRIGGVLMSMDTLRYYYTPGNNALYGHTPGKLQYLAETLGIVKFDYNYMIDYYDFDTKRNNEDITEVWVYAPPFGGMYESQLVGPGAFWYNSPPLQHPGLNKLLPIMGWNYERGVAEALHSFGHRAESAMVHVYGRWDVTNPNPNPWELFTRIDIVIPDSAHVGNIHYPPNGTSDYDYANPRYVITYADNWKRYPILLDQIRQVNRMEWYHPGPGGTADYHRGFMKWWMNHLPRFTGVHEGILNNWWHYIVDYEAAVELANQLVSLEENARSAIQIPRGFLLEQNYPNPFNPRTTIRFYLPQAEEVTLTVFDILGRKIKVLANGKISAGSHTVEFDASGLASGLYFYQLKGKQQTLTKKMLFIK